MIALVVDDSSAMRRIQQRAMEELGWEVHTASSGEDALTRLASLSGCDLLLTDWHMPGMGGMELVKAIRRDVRFINTRVVMVSSDSVLTSVDKALAAGADDFLMKPFTPESFVERIREVMGG